MEKKRNQIMYAAIGMLFMGLLEFTSIGMSSIVVPLLMAGLYVWAFVMTFKISSPGSKLRIGSIIALVYVVFYVAQYLSVRFIGYLYLVDIVIGIIKSALLIAAVILMMIDLRHDLRVMIPGCLCVVGEIIGLIAAFIPVNNNEILLSDGGKNEVGVALFFMFLALPVFIYFVAKSGEVKYVPKESNEESEKPAFAQDGIAIKEGDGFTAFDVVAIIMASIALFGVITIDKIDHSFFRYVDAWMYPLIYSFFTFLALAGAFYSLSRIRQMNRATSDVAAGKADPLLMVLGGLGILISILGFALGDEVASEVKRHGVWNVIVSPLTCESKLMFDILGLGSVLMAFGWLQKSNVRIKALKNTVAEKMPSIEQSLSMKVFCALSCVLGGFFVFLVVKGIVDDELFDMFGIYYVHMCFSTFVVALACLLLYFVFRNKQRIHTLAQFYHPQPEIENMIHPDNQ